MHDDPIVIVGAARTPDGGLPGKFKRCDGAGTRWRSRSSAAVANGPVCKPEDIDDVVMGLVSVRRI